MFVREFTVAQFIALGVCSEKAGKSIFTFLPKKV